MRSFTSRYLEEKRIPTLEDEELIKAAAASLYSGGADTVSGKNIVQMPYTSLDTRTMTDTVVDDSLHPRDDVLARHSSSSPGGARRCRRPVLDAVSDLRRPCQVAIYQRDRSRGAPMEPCRSAWARTPPHRRRHISGLANTQGHGRLGQYMVSAVVTMTYLTRD